MAQGVSVVSLGELLQTPAESEREDDVLERLKLLAQENFPEGWTNWTIQRASKEEIFGESLDPQLLNKLRYALPTIGIAKAFNPDAENLSEKCYRDIKVKMLDWEFTRALIISPPSLGNKIRGSAAQSELFIRAIDALRPNLISRSEADRILSGVDSESEKKARKRSSSASSSQPKRSKVDELEQKMDNMFSLLLEKIENLKSDRVSILEEMSDPGESDKENDPFETESVSYADTVKAPPLNPDLQDEQEEDMNVLDFRPEVKEAEPPIPEPLPHIKLEGIECQRLGLEGWSRLRYKDVEKRLHAAPVFSTLKINTELGDITNYSSTLAKQDGMLGTIVHGLLLQRRILSEELKALTKKHPNAAGDVCKILAEDSRFKGVLDDLLQFACGHRAETIEMRRKVFKARNDILSASLQQIPPSTTHLFDEKHFASFVRDNGGAKQVFLSHPQYKKPFRKPAATAAQTQSYKQLTWRARPAVPAKSSQISERRGSTQRPTNAVRIDRF